MGIIGAIIGLFYLTYRYGKEEGKWGCFTSLCLVALLFLILCWFQD